jgi:hypothetical protein
VNHLTGYEHSIWLSTEIEKYQLVIESRKQFTATVQIILPNDIVILTAQRIKNIKI